MPLIEKANIDKKVIVFGASGAIGTAMIKIMSEQKPKWQITAVARSNAEKFADMENVTVVPGDAADKEEVTKLCKDKDLVYCCIGFPQYETQFWADTWPVVIDNLLAASSQGFAQKFVFCDNLYAYGAKTDMKPTGEPVEANLESKPGIRAVLRQKLQERMKAHPQSIAVVGGSDFFGEGVTDHGFMGDTFTKKIVKAADAGKKSGSALAIGSASKIHDFCYVQDFANALYLTGSDARANGKFWICPHSIKGKTMNEIAQDIARVAKHGPKSEGSDDDDDAEAPKQGPKVKVWVLGPKIVNFLGKFMSFMREMKDMLPIWINDYSVDDSDFCKAFKVEATPYEEALQGYITFYRSEFEKQKEEKEKAKAKK